MAQAVGVAGSVALSHHLRIAKRFADARHTIDDQPQVAPSDVGHVFNVPFQPLSSTLKTCSTRYSTTRSDGATYAWNSICLIGSTTFAG